MLYMYYCLFGMFIILDYSSALEYSIIRRYTNIVYYYYYYYYYNMHTADFQSESGKKNCFRIARHMAREGRHVISAV